MKSLIDYDGELYLIENFIPPDEAEALFSELYENLAWAEEEISIYGRPVKVPRLVAWYGDAEAIYTYSGVRHKPLPWSDRLRQLKQRVESKCGQQFNSVLANLYRHGQDSMGWHADKEKELGPNPCIASLSLGQERLFKLRHNKTKETLDLKLGSGSLLIMADRLQHCWRHCVPKSQKEMGPRINLTFRKIVI